MIVLTLLLATLLSLNAAYCIVKVRSEMQVGIWAKLWGVVSAAAALAAGLFLIVVLGLAYTGV